MPAARARAASAWACGARASTRRGTRCWRRCPRASCCSSTRWSSDAKVANRNGRDFGWDIAQAVTDARRFPSTRWYAIPEATRTMLLVWDLSIIQGPVSVAPCQTLALRFATCFVASRWGRRRRCGRGCSSAPPTAASRGARRSACLRAWRARPRTKCCCCATVRAQPHPAAHGRREEQEPNEPLARTLLPTLRPPGIAHGCTHAHTGAAGSSFWLRFSAKDPL